MYVGGGFTTSKYCHSFSQHSKGILASKISSSPHQMPIMHHINKKILNNSLKDIVMCNMHPLPINLNKKKRKDTKKKKHFSYFVPFFLKTGLTSLFHLVQEANPGPKDGWDGCHPSF